MSKMPRKQRKPTTSTVPTPAAPADFDEVLRMIDAARVWAVAAVNTVLIDLYWQIGENISRKIASGFWGEGTVKALAEHIQRRQHGMRGLSAHNLWHMRQLAVFKDTYLPEFLDLPPEHSEADLQRALVEKLKQFLIEQGRDFCFIGGYYPLQVGGRDFEIDLLFFNRALNCLIACELQIEDFQPAHRGQLEFYLETLDRDVRKPHEGPSIGVLLCATKDYEAVEYAPSLDSHSHFPT